MTTNYIISHLKGVSMDQNKVRLIAHTQWAGGQGDDGNIMAYCARVSNPSNQTNWQTEGKLLSYCAKNEHWSVFEMSNVIMEIETTRDIARQILRHRSFHFQEFSQRYAEPGKELGHVTREARLQDAKNRQASHSTDNMDLRTAFMSLQESVIRSAKSAYDWAITNGIAKEQARAVMPEGMTMSRMYMNGTVRDWFHFCRVRRGNGAQLECQDVANKCWEHLTKLYPFLLEVETREADKPEDQSEIKALKQQIAILEAQLEAHKNPNMSLQAAQEIIKQQEVERILGKPKVT